MRTRTHITVTALLVATTLALAGSALADATYVPTPTTNDLGIGENDVREEPDHNQDDNRFPEDPEVWSPKDDPLVFDAYAQKEFGTIVQEDLSNVLNVLLHGDQRGAYQNYMFPGQVSHEAWWGYWSDVGGGGDLQQNPNTAKLPTVGEPNGAIDDFTDQQAGGCRDRNDPSWDEFVWRGANKCADEAGVPEANTLDDMDEMYTFIQPGTHDMHVNTLVSGCSCPDDAVLRNDTDRYFQPDFAMEYPEPTQGSPAGGEIWRQSNGFTRIMYDQSLLVSTKVTVSVNPTSITEDVTAPGPAFDPHTAAEEPHAVDVDIYSSVHPVVEDAYRMAVWDPPQDHGDDEDEENVFADVLYESGPKGFLKYPGHQAWLDAQERANDEASAATAGALPLAGAGEDLVYGPYHHEPNEPDDVYRDQTGADLVTYDGHNSYGGTDGDYYENPDASADYTAYEEGENFWADAQVGFNDCPVWAYVYCYGGYDHFTPEIPSTSSGEATSSTLQEDDGDNTLGPGVLYWHANAGTWYDRNGDNWVGDASTGMAISEQGQSAIQTSEGHPYAGGMIEDPNQYGSKEFRGSSSVVWDVQLVPTRDHDGDGVDDWGRSGVYVVGDFNDGNPYSDAAMDVGGTAADPVLGPVRNDDTVGTYATYAAPPDEKGRLSRYRRTGPIDMQPIEWDSNNANAGPGNYDSFRAIVFPTGSLDVSFKVVSEATLNDDSLKGKYGDTQGTPLDGSHVTDIDRVGSIPGSG